VVLDPLSPFLQSVLPAIVGLLGGVAVGNALARRGVQAATALQGRQPAAWATLVVCGLGAWAWYAGLIQNLLPPGLQPHADLTLHPTATALASFVVAFLPALERSGWNEPERRRRMIVGVSVTSLLLGYLGWLSLPVRPSEDLTLDGVVLQSTPFTCSAASIATIARLTGVDPTFTEAAAAEIARTTFGGTLTTGELRAVHRLGLEGRFARRLDVDSLVAHAGPAILHVNEPVAGGRRIRHAVALLAIDVPGRTLTIGNPLEGRQEIPFDELGGYWIGEAVLVVGPG
jgi:hypothetical protein